MSSVKSVAGIVAVLTVPAGITEKKRVTILVKEILTAVPVAIGWLA
ncbi:hypothetical protein AB4Z22_17670 [Paenibacillus sp. TAF58]